MGKRRLEEPDESDLPLEGQLALLQVDYEVMKVENRELRKRLMKALRAPKPAPLRAKEAPKEKVYNQPIPADLPKEKRAALVEDPSCAQPWGGVLRRRVEDW
eukprot:g31497.t1